MLNVSTKKNRLCKTLFLIWHFLCCVMKSQEIHIKMTSVKVSFLSNLLPEKVQSWALTTYVSKKATQYPDPVQVLCMYHSSALNDSNMERWERRKVFSEECFYLCQRQFTHRSQVNSDTIRNGFEILLYLSLFQQAGLLKLRGSCVWVRCAWKPGQRTGKGL